VTSADVEVEEEDDKEEEEEAARRASARDGGMIGSRAREEVVPPIL
jgi:hypothetical protein